MLQLISCVASMLICYNNSSEYVPFSDLNIFVGSKVKWSQICKVLGVSFEIGPYNFALYLLFKVMQSWVV